MTIQRAPRPYKQHRVTQCEVKQDPEKRPIFRPENLAKSENLPGPQCHHELLWITSPTCKRRTVATELTSKGHDHSASPANAGILPPRLPRSACQSALSRVLDAGGYDDKPGLGIFGPGDQLSDRNCVDWALTCENPADSEGLCGSLRSLDKLGNLKGMHETSSQVDKDCLSPSCELATAIGGPCRAKPATCRCI